MTPDTPDAAAIVTEGLVKRYGAVKALDAVDLRVDGGESVALFGPNGAGKTTLIRLLTLSLRPGSGRVSIDGLDPRRDDLDIRRRIGLISHQSFLYDDLSALENLEFYGQLYGVERPQRRSRELLQQFGLELRMEDPVRTFSRGMQQRVSVARALVHDPAILFLDEPFTGLDPHAAELLCATLRTLREQGRTVVLVTHNLKQGLELSDRWLILARGRVVAEGHSAETDSTTFDETYSGAVAKSRRADRGA